MESVSPPDHIDKIIQLWKRERPDFDLAPVEIIGRAGRIMEHVDRALNAKFEEFGISRASFDVLATLRRTGEPYRLTQRELMQSLLRTSGSMSLRIDSLESQGLVERRPDDDDRRSVFVTLTQKGAHLLETVIPEHLANEKRLVAALNQGERAQLVTLLRKWLSSLEADEWDGGQLYLGLTFLSARASLAMRRAVGLADAAGLLVHAVSPNSPAEESGFRKGDLVCAIEDQPVNSLMDLRRVLNKREPKTKRVQLLRGAHPIELKLRKFPR
jgi:DNA-binding MarR family transcriptional regulator